MNPLTDKTPEELIQYIKELRAENKQRREASERYEDAFANVNTDDQRILLNIISTFGRDPQQGAASFRRLADHIAPQTHQKEDMNNPFQPAPAPQPPQGQQPQQTPVYGQPPADQPPAWFAEFAKSVNEKIDAVKAQVDDQIKAAADAQQQQVQQQVINEATTLGYTQGTPEWDQLFTLAQSFGSLEMADRVLKVVNNTNGKSPEGGEGGESGQPVSGEGQQGQQGQQGQPPAQPAQPAGTGSPAVAGQQGGVPSPSLSQGEPDNSLRTAAGRADDLLKGLFAE